MSYLDEIIGHFFDSNGNKGEMRLKDVYGTEMEMLKLMYIDYMLRCTDADFDTFKEIHLKATGIMIDVIHSKYADHVEGLRNSFDEKQSSKEKKDG